METRDPNLQGFFPLLQSLSASLKQRMSRKDLKKKRKKANWPVRRGGRRSGKGPLTRQILVSVAFCFQTRALVKGCWPNLFDPVHASPAVLLPPLLTHFQRLPCSRMCCTTKFPKVSRHSCGAPLSTSPAGGWNRNGVKLCKTGSFPCLWGANTRMSNPLYLKKLCV